MSRTSSALVVAIVLPACTILFPFGASAPDAGSSGRDAAVPGRDAGGPGRDAAVELDAKVGEDSGPWVDAGSDAGPCGDTRVVDQQGSSASAVAVLGSHAYVGRWSSGIRVFDIGNPAKMRICGEIPLDATDGNETSIRSDGAALWVSKEEGGVFRLTFPAENFCGPVTVPFSPGYAVDAIPCGDLICTAGDDFGVDALDGNGTLTDHVDVPGAMRLAVSGDHLLVATGWLGLVSVIDLATMQPSPTWIGERAADIAIVDDELLLVAAGDEGLILYSIIGLPTLDFVSFEATDHPAVVVATDGEWAFVGTGADPDGWVEIFDIRDHADPSPFAVVGLPHDVQGIDLTATHAFVAADDPLVALDRGCAR